MQAKFKMMEANVAANTSFIISKNIAGLSQLAKRKDLQEVTAAVIGASELEYEAQKVED